jgi:sulfur-carrier protein
MDITIKLFASFRIGRFKEKQLCYPANYTCSQIAADLGIQIEECGIVMINGQHKRHEDVLSDGDLLSLLPLLGGG